MFTETFKCNSTLNNHMKRGVVLFVLILLSLSAAAVTVDTLLLKVTLKQNEKVERIIQVDVHDVHTSTSLGLPIKIYPTDKGSDIAIQFDGEREPGIYAGKLEIKEGDLNIPVILEVESQHVFFDSTLSIAPQYATVAPGSKIAVQLTVFDLIQRNEDSLVDVEYALFDMNGKKIASEEEKISLRNRIQLTKSIALPEFVEEGDYLFGVILEFNGAVSTSTQLFHVAHEDKVWIDEAPLLLIISFLFFVVLICLFVYLMRDHDRHSIVRFQDNELRRHNEFLAKQAEALKKKMPEKSIEKEVKKQVSEFKKQQNKQREELKKSAGRDKMLWKINQWKKDGYNTWGLEYRLKGVSTEEMKKIMDEFNRKYRPKK